MSKNTYILLCSCVLINSFPLYSKEMSPSNIVINTIPCSILKSSDTTFTTTAKVSAVVMGSFFGFFLGGTIGALSIERNDDRIGGVLIGGGIGVIVGPFLNYFIISQLAKKEARRQRESQQARSPKFDMAIYCNPICHHSKNLTLSLNIDF